MSFLFSKRGSATKAPSDNGPFVAPSPSGPKPFGDVRAASEARSKNAIRLAYLSGCVAILAMLTTCSYAHQPRLVPHVILVTNDGHSTTVKPIQDDPVLRQVVTSGQLRRFIKSLYTRSGSVDADTAALASDVSPLVLSNSPAYTTINGYLTDPGNNPKTATTVTRVSVDSPQARAGDALYVKWSVKTYRPTGEILRSADYDATALFRYRTLNTADEQDANPTGLTITQFNPAQISASGSPVNGTP